MIRISDDHLFNAPTTDVERLARYLKVKVAPRREGESYGTWHARVVRAIQRAEKRLEQRAHDFVQVAAIGRRKSL
jgi:flagellar biosynthesis chaperone FliJ